ncbi:hypothetical protein [Lysinibacillus sp. 54212]|uniref:hypothetical protein n=1 Tax=Lysinibacillus sp. 54212 TaxID=3119829 RepID=UPI002FC77072
MEGIIMMIVIFIISSLLNKDKKKEQKPMPPFGQQEIPDANEPAPKSVRPTRKSLEDFANEVFDQLNEKTPSPKEVVQKSVQPTVPVFEKAEQAVEKELLKRVQERKSNRPELAAGRPLLKKLEEKRNASFAVPNSREQLVQAIITSEILGPPKAKQHK